MPPIPIRQEIEPKLTIEPPPAAIMPGATAWMAKNWCFRLTASLRVEALRRLALPVVARVVGGVVDEDGDRPERGGDAALSRPSGLPMSVMSTSFEPGCRTLPGELVGERPPLRVEDVDEANLGALPGEGAHDRLADAACAAGNEDGPSGEAWIGGVEVVRHGHSLPAQNCARLR